MDIRTLQTKIKALISELQESLESLVMVNAKQIFEQGNCCVLTQSSEGFSFIVESENLPVSIAITE